VLKPAEITAFRQRLVEERAALEREDAQGAEDRRAVTLDQQSVGRLSRMDAMQRQAMAEATKRRRALRRLRIDGALARIDADDFGYCQECGEDIGPERLSLDPAAPNCLSCAKG
jgi:DnaK suppressor protein